ncbi:MAG: hypothetical protein VXU42_01450, partial [Verrucomicrobiota bacterium]|nr:hypothetical protein [Verrucomicrobiota bacterium]
TFAISACGVSSGYPLADKDPVACGGGPGSRQETVAQEENHREGSVAGVQPGQGINRRGTGGNKEESPCH